MVTLTAGAYLHNTGEINTTGPVAVEATGRATIVNSGTIDPSGPGVYLAAGGVLTNVAGGYIGGGSYGIKINGSAVGNGHQFRHPFGHEGVYVAGAGTANQTLIDSGTIIGTGGTAVAFGAGTNLLVDDPGAVFIGSVVAAGTTTLGAGLRRQRRHDRGLRHHDHQFQFSGVRFRRAMDGDGQRFR